MRDIEQNNRILGRRLRTEDRKTFVNKDWMKRVLFILNVAFIFQRVSHFCFDAKLITNQKIKKNWIHLAIKGVNRLLTCCLGLPKMHKTRLLLVCRLFATSTICVLQFLSQTTLCIAMYFHYYFIITISFLRLLFDSFCLSFICSF